MLAFSAVNAVALKPLPIRDPARCISAVAIVLLVVSGLSGFSDRVRGTEALMGYGIAMINVGLADSALIWWGYLATGNYFEGLGIERRRTILHAG